MKKLFQFDIVRFGLVGASGFAINFLILTLLFKILSLPIFIAQLCGAEIALFSNFVLHDRWTYNRNNVTKTFGQLLVQFHVTSWVAIIGSALLVSFLVDTLHQQYIVALVASSAVAFAWNFLTTKFYVWRRVHHAEVIKEG